MYLPMSCLAMVVVADNANTRAQSKPALIVLRNFMVNVLAFVVVAAAAVVVVGVGSLGIVTRSKKHVGGDVWSVLDGAVNTENVSKYATW